MMYENQDLRTLIEGYAHQGDPTAISEIYRRYAGTIVRYIAIRVTDVELAQDLTQEVFIRVIHALHRFTYRGEKAFLGWLFTIAANVLTSYQRRKRPPTAPLSAQHDLVDTRSVEAVRTVAEYVDLRRALAQLTDDQQQVLTLRFFADLSNCEVATILHRSEASIKAIQYRAIRSLQRMLHSDRLPHETRLHRHSQPADSSLMSTLAPDPR
jgi:RNA polymerase sigma-70 factor (ECF subfamily)